VPAPAPTDWLIEDTVKVHGTGAAAACDTVNGCPPTVSVAVRAVGSVFGPTVNWTVPVPVPVAPAVIVAHAAPLVAVHAHEAAEAVTVTVPDPPVAATD